jgi:hypothetical protein
MPLSLLLTFIHPPTCAPTHHAPHSPTCAPTSVTEDSSASLTHVCAHLSYGGLKRLTHPRVRPPQLRRTQAPHSPTCAPTSVTEDSSASLIHVCAHLSYGGLKRLTHPRAHLPATRLTHPRVRPPQLRRTQVDGCQLGPKNRVLDLVGRNDNQAIPRHHPRRRARDG